MIARQQRPRGYSTRATTKSARDNNARVTKKLARQLHSRAYNVRATKTPAQL